MRYDAAVGFAVELYVDGGGGVVETDVAICITGEADQLLGRRGAADGVDLRGGGRGVGGRRVRRDANETGEERSKQDG